VRTEIAVALRRDIRVIPVLVDGALMPRSTDLPDDLKQLVRRNALEVGDTHFDDDCRRLIAAIEQVLEAAQAERPPRARLKGSRGAGRRGRANPSLSQAQGRVPARLPPIGLPLKGLSRTLNGRGSYWLS
jgi:hypothetical protein